MAWRIEEQVIRGEIDSRTRGKVSGRLWLVGREEPVILELEGSPWRDLAGHLLRFSNPQPKPGLRDSFATEQTGVVGDITASRKVKVPEIPMDELMERYRKKEPFPWHWGNSLYLEWFSRCNGRVVIESVDYVLELDGTAAWSMNDEDEVLQRQANAEAMTAFMDRMLMESGLDEDDDDDPQSQAEEEADAEAARMDLLLDRVQARIGREGPEHFERILTEEREKLRIERDEAEPKLTPEEQAERLARRQSWLEEMDEICEQAASEVEAESWKDEEKPARHPLVLRSIDLTLRFYQDVSVWLPQEMTLEHPLACIANSSSSATAKLSGALGMVNDGEWPPDKLFAGDVLVRLKKARGHLRDVIAGVDAADHDDLATPEWRNFVRYEIGELLGEVGSLIDEVRALLADGEQD